MPTAKAQTIPLGLWKLFALTRDVDDTPEAANLKAMETLPHAQRIVDMLREGCDDTDLTAELRRAMETQYPDGEHESDFGYPLLSAFYVGVAAASLLNGDDGGVHHE